MYRVGDQIVEAIRVHSDVSKKQAEQRVIELLGAVGIPKPKERIATTRTSFRAGCARGR